jgi:hypothetical protein
MYVLESAPMTDIETIVQQLREERDRLDRAITALESMTNNAAARPTAIRGERRRFSAAATAKMRAAQRARRVRERGSQGSGGGQSVRKASRGRKGGFSPEHLARLRAAAKKRWAKVRAGKKK